MLLSAFIRKCTTELESLYPSPEAKSIVLMLCEAILGTKHYTYVLEPHYEIAPESQAILDAALLRLSSGEPIQYVLGQSEFYGRIFHLSPSVLIPRPETEQLVQIAIEVVSNLRTAPRVLDLCTGSGCIAWSLALELNSPEVIAVDVSEAALQIARLQFEGDQSACTKAPVFVKADILDTEQAFPYGQFELLTANPPYIMEKEKVKMRANVLNYEPSLALYVTDDDPLIFYRAIARWGQRFLKQEGLGIVEINESLAPQTQAIFTDAGFRNIEILSDYFGKHRFVKFIK